MGPIADGLVKAILREVAELPAAAHRTAVAAAFDRASAKVKRRLVDDLRRLNKVTRDSTGFKYPALEELFHDGWNASEMLKLIDWRLGYHHLRIHPDSQLYFCFAHPVKGVLFCWTRLPMGWTQSAMVFVKQTALVASCIRDWGGVPGAHPALQYADGLLRRMGSGALAEEARAFTTTCWRSATSGARCRRKRRRRQCWSPWGARPHRQTNA